MTEKGVQNIKSAEVEITVNVIDRNDNSPQFPPDGYTIQVKEGTGRREVIKVGICV